MVGLGVVELGKADPELSDPLLRDHKADFLIELIPAKSTETQAGEFTGIPWTER